MTALALSACVVLALSALMLARALAAGAPPPAGTLDPGALDTWAGAENRLSALVRIPTVSRFDPADEDASAFSRFTSELSMLYPLAHGRLLAANAGDRAIVLEWPGSDGSLAPVILTAHFDVVPPGERSRWDRDPFGGAVENGYVHGRGTQDIKITLCAAMEAAERLLADGFVPKRTIFLAFGGDEEVGGVRGAARIADYLAGRGIKASFLLDEGGFVADGFLGFADRPLALVGISEKGYMDVALEADGAGGHASMPPRHTAAGVVSKAVAAIEARPFKGVVSYTLAGFLRALVPYSPFIYRLLFGNLWLTAPLVKRALARSPETNALVRTTAAATMLSGSDKENVLPDKARAVLNVRILPGSSVSEALGRLERLARRAGARAILAHDGHVNDPLPESPVDHEGFAAISRAIADSHPEAGTIPFMFTAGTDTKHYRNVAQALYRFAPIRQDRADLAGVHGANERISVDNVRRACLFYCSLMRGL
ncbi:MAG: M20/M25/M40 family metallo-hydrolase [Spirochaetales bacterium]|nr:M20/M25/M40 family metallo-hydrolase [Spirochaetales bacterium]MBP7264129.1 M20/M25/M40 family metallo-hydrolase [Spirochaetia bacterium]